MIRRALAAGVHDIVYAGLPRNTESDLDDQHRMFRRAAVGVGTMGEAVWELKKTARKER